MNVNVSLHFTANDEKELDAIIDAVCDVLVEHGKCTGKNMNDDTPIESMVLTYPADEDAGSDEWIERIAKPAVKVAIPVSNAQIIPIGTASEANDAKGGA